MRCKGDQRCGISEMGEEALKEAKKCIDTGEEKVILFNLSGHGFVDMAAYDSYFSGEMTNYELTDEELAKYQASADALNQ